MNSRRFITVGWAKLKVIFRNKAVTVFVKQNVLTFARNGAFGRGSGLRFCRTLHVRQTVLVYHFNLRRRTLSHDVRCFGPTCIAYTLIRCAASRPMFASSDGNKTL